ncbi:conserved unknown protein [Ectocarpus siliculosus]|uniref:UVR domain-containing protein n=1 Tax=Ectocarpus siliculosus TaxID=2880 RepID=D7FWK2_ECTSI|nr:conserved unknown protein [Ectocarpus siliculosus]|eukprot:CBJ32090.1 conserved unknown protein [Ectocarpus siliculosus]
MLAASSSSSPPMPLLESAAGVFSAFQFMAEPAAPSDKAAPIGGSPPSAGGGGPGMSAFSFLTDESPAAGNSVEGQDETVSIPAGDAAGRTTPSSFSFLSEGGGGGPAAESSVAAEAASSVVLSSSPLAATGKAELPASSDGKAAAEFGGAAGQTPGDVDQQPAGSSGLASEVSSPSASSSTTARADGLAATATATATATAAQEGAEKKPAADDVPSWKPSASVVRKKRAVRRVGYAREETLASSSMAPPVPRSPTAGRQAGGGNASTEAAGDQTSGSTPSATAGGGLSRGGGGDYEAPSVPIPSRKVTTSPMTAGREAMDDSMVAEAAAMAALAASMAPSEIQGAMAKGDLKQGSSHGTASSSTSSAAGGGAAASLSNPHPTATKKNHSFMTKFKGLLSQSSSSKSDSSPLSPHAAARKSAANPTVATTPRSSPKDAAAAAATTKAGEEDQPPLRSERGGADPDSAAGGGSSVVRPAFSGEEENGAVQEMRAELSVLIDAFQQKSESLSNRLTEAAAEKAALECSRTSLRNSHAEGIRRLAEAESEQQRLADEEDYEKAAELSLEIENLKEESASAARRLRELEEDGGSLDRSSAEARHELLVAVEETTRGLKVFQGRQDAKLGKLVSERAALFEEENRRMNTEQERIVLEKTHVERDWAHLEEELSQTEKAISDQTGGEDARMSKLRLMRMELEGEVKDLEAQLEAKRGALREVLVGLDEAEGRISAVRGKFERQLQRLRERERLVEVSRQDCQTEEASLQGDRDRHRELMEQATKEQQGLMDAVEGIADDVKLAEVLQSTLSKHWTSESRTGTVPADEKNGAETGDEDSRNDARDDALVALRSEVEGARSRYELKGRAVAALDERKDVLKAEMATNADALPDLEQRKRAAVGAKNYKEAGQVSRQIKETERRQQEVLELLSDLEHSVAEGSAARKELEGTKTELMQAEEALRVAEEAVATSRIAALERRAKPLRIASRAVARRGKTGGLRDAAESLLVVQLASLDAEAKDISARHGLAPPELSQPQPGDSDDESDGSGSGGGGGGSDCSAGPAAGGSGQEVVTSVEVDEEDGGSADGNDVEAAKPEDTATHVEAVPRKAEDDPAMVASRELIELEAAEVERDLADLDARLATALTDEDYDQAAELDAQMTQEDVDVDAAAACGSAGEEGRGEEHGGAGGNATAEAMDGNVATSEEDTDGCAAEADSGALDPVPGAAAGQEAGGDAPDDDVDGVREASDEGPAVVDLEEAEHDDAPQGRESLGVEGGTAVEQADGPERAV